VAGISQAAAREVLGENRRGQIIGWAVDPVSGNRPAILLSPMEAEP
jgi:hypothetical protein